MDNFTYSEINVAVHDGDTATLKSLVESDGPSILNPYFESDLESDCWALYQLIERSGAMENFIYICQVRKVTPQIDILLQAFDEYLEYITEEGLDTNEILNELLVSDFYELTKSNIFNNVPQEIIDYCKSIIH